MEEFVMEPSYPGPQSAHHELRTAQNSAAFVLPTLQCMEEVNPCLTLLDVGAGSGTISVTLAKAIPGGKVTAMDLNAEILPRAAVIADLAGVQNIEFQQGDVYHLPYPDGSFDITFCHQVLTHLKAPWNAIAEMMRVTKSGGIVAAREGDLETECVWPELPGLLKFHQFVAGMMNAAGGSSTGGRQLLSWALKADAERGRVTVSYGTWSYNSPGDKRVWAQALMDKVRAGRLREGGLKSGLVTRADLDEMARAWEEWAELEDASVAMMHGEIVIQK
ncbi:hypothetical protein LTR37_021371 [Vermiconidia calcicola]|uniref:Uncharacterized protein n=1 Tax=Vermiconidia calcicola TaxID=1690605 RepID=A0ACC3M8R3_9PEZI|nr:hypothetical protein LTR37_021371 [Vermiconidia calcicola]